MISMCSSYEVEQIPVNFLIPAFQTGPQGSDEEELNICILYRSCKTHLFQFSNEIHGRPWSSRQSSPRVPTIRSAAKTKCQVEASNTVDFLTTFI
jgi:hypothetical protein